MAAPTPTTTRRMKEFAPYENLRSPPLQRLAQKRVDYDPLASLVRRSLAGKFGAAVLQLRAVLTEAADRVVAQIVCWEPDLAVAVTQ